jgi:hypothetical protein
VKSGIPLLWTFSESVRDNPGVRSVINNFENFAPQFPDWHRKANAFNNLRYQRLPGGNLEDRFVTTRWFRQAIKIFWEFYAATSA